MWCPKIYWRQSKFQRVLYPSMEWIVMILWWSATPCPCTHNEHPNSATVVNIVCLLTHTLLVPCMYVCYAGRAWSLWIIRGQTFVEWVRDELFYRKASASSLSTVRYATSCKILRPVIYLQRYSFEGQIACTSNLMHLISFITSH
jgi:hypothetical protein